MEKLQKLLDEYQETIKNTEKIDWEVALDIEMLGIYAKTCVAYSISKQFGFIKWLVENDKVVWNFIDYAEIHKTKRELESNYEPCDIEKQYYERLLMLLSIQDNPIEFLVKILK